MPAFRTAALLGFGCIALLSTACGNSSDSSSSSGTRTVDIEMVDIAYKPTEIAVAKGEEVRFVFANKGSLVHEALLGTPAAQDDHEQEMAKGAASGHHDMEHMSGTQLVTVAPGKTGEFTTTFDKAGSYVIGCHEPGHYAQGMKITVKVS